MEIAEKEISTIDLLNGLRRKYTENQNWKTPQWSFFPELRAGTGFDNEAMRSFDFWAIDAYGGNSRISFEIKISRGDFQKEIKNPKKRRMALLFSNLYYFVTPPGLIKLEELPPECGLMEGHWTNNQDEIDKLIAVNKAHEERGWKNRAEIPPFQEFLKIVTKHKAPHRDSMPPTWCFVASLARRINELERKLTATEQTT